MTKEQSRAIRRLRWLVDEAEAEAAKLRSCNLPEIPEVARLLARAEAARVTLAIHEEHLAAVRGALRHMVGDFEKKTPAEIGGEIRRIAGVG